MIGVIGNWKNNVLCYKIFKMRIKITKYVKMLEGPKSLRLVSEQMNRVEMNLRRNYIEKIKLNNRHYFIDFIKRLFSDNVQSSCFHSLNFNHLTKIIEN